MTARRLVLLWAGLAVLAHTLPGFLPASEAEDDAFPTQSRRTLRYDIDCRLDAAAHVVEATGTLSWRNDATDAARDMHFHLYLNAFRNLDTTFFRDVSERRRERFDDHHPGGIELTRLERDGRDLLAKAEYPAVEGAQADRTVLRVPLADPIAPGETATFSLAWKSYLPKVVARSGFGGPFHMVAQWYPKPGVFCSDPPGPGAWNCHEYHARSEFFADYGVYRVRITVPETYVGRVGATGVCTNPEGRRGEDGSVTYDYVAEDVHDFAWVCDDDFVVEEHTFEGGDGTAPEERRRMTEILGRDPGPLAPVTVRLLLQPAHAEQSARHRDAAFHALSYMGHWFGPYPYPVLTVVDPDHRARGAGGMEYPTLITAGTGYRPAPWGWSPMFVVVHEFGHQHFYGLVGTNEFEDAWMDEGLTTWATARVMERAYGPRPSTTRYADLPLEGERMLPFDGWLATAPRAVPVLVRWLEDDVDLPWLGSPWPQHGEATALSFLREVPPLTLLDPLPIRVAEHERTRLAERDLVDPVVERFAWHHMDGRSYGTNSYRRVAAVMRTLEAYVGEAAVLRWIRRYVERHRFGHPGPSDLLQAWTDANGDDLRPRLAALFDEVGHVDYGVSEIRDVGRKELGEQEAVLRRHGLSTAFPVDVLVTFEDGSTRRYAWHPADELTSEDGGVAAVTRAPPAVRGVDPVPTPFRGRWRGLLFGERWGQPSRVVAVEIDPERRLHLDRDRTNDGRRVEAGARPSLRIALRLLGWVEMNTSFYGGL